MSKLILCPTPIGNLEDISLRALRVLKEVDFIGAEDTRHSLRLLNHYGIKKPLVSYHQHNIMERSSYLIDRIKSGETMALISDAGMPGISDPGQELVRLALDEGVEVECLPGPTASLVALIISGLATDRFVFWGFLPSKKTRREEEIERLKKIPYTSIIYESPHRIRESLDDLYRLLGPRQVSVSRELTKKFEETFRGSLEEAVLYFKDKTIKGEFVIVLEGYEEEEKEVNIEEELESLIDLGYSKKEAVKKVSEDFQIPKNKVYKVSLELF